MSALDLRPLAEPLSAADVRAFRAGASWRIGIATSGPLIVAIILVPTAVVFTSIMAGVLGPVVPVGITLAAGFLGVAAITAAAITAYRGLWRHLARLSRLADRNGWTLTPQISEPGWDALIFRAGIGRVVRDLLEGESVTPFGVGAYRHLVGSDRTRRARHWGFVRLDLDRELPHIVLDAVANDPLLRSDLPIRLDRHEVIRLEGDFDRHFRVHAPEGRATDVLSILTPDVMAALVDDAADVDVEILGRRMWFFRPGRIDLESPAEWRRIERILVAVGRVAARQTEHYTDATVGDDDLDARVSPVRRFLRRNAASLLIAAGLAVQGGWAAWAITRGL